MLRARVWEQTKTNRDRNRVLSSLDATMGSEESEGRVRVKDLGVSCTVVFLRTVPTGGCFPFSFQR